MIKTMKIRLFPTEGQETLMWKHIGCSRWIWNYMLAKQQELYSAGEKHLSAFDMNYLITDIKKQEEYQWLNEVSTQTLYRSCADLDKAYKNFFKKTAKHPRFKSRKKDKNSFPLCDTKGKVYFKEDNIAHLPIIGNMKYQTTYNIPLGNKQKFSNPRITLTTKGKWILTVGIECESQAIRLTDKTMGIDLGVKELAIVAFDDECIKYGNINKSKNIKQLERKLNHLKRNVSRKYAQHGNHVKTKNIIKAEKKVALLSEHIANIRQNNLHQITHSLVSMLPSKVVIEDLNVSGMMKNKHLSKAIQEQKFYEFIRQMEYKCIDAGIEFIKADRFYPSSKTCSVCGNIKSDLKLKDRTYICPACGLEIDRDYNAAINLMNYSA